MDGLLQRRFEGVSDAARKEAGHALFLAQIGMKSPKAEPMRGFGGASILKIVEDYDGNTYRAVYTVKFKAAVVVLHAFQKKSKRGAETPQEEVEKIKIRLKAAIEFYAKRSN